MREKMFLWKSSKKVWFAFSRIFSRNSSWACFDGWREKKCSGGLFRIATVGLGGGARARPRTSLSVNSLMKLRLNPLDEKRRRSAAQGFTSAPDSNTDEIECVISGGASTSRRFLEDEETEYQRLLEEENCHLAPGEFRRVLILQPKVNWGKNKPKNTTPELMMAEAKALIETLPGWTVSDAQIASVQYSTKRKHVFGTGKVFELMELVGNRSRHSFNAIMINVDMLSGSQHSELFQLLKVPIYDRYNIVLQIFKTYAKTAEAKLQIALAEIPYLRVRVRPLQEAGDLQEEDSVYASQLDSIGGSGGKSYWQKRTELLKHREQKLKRQLHKIRSEREARANAPKRKKFPIVAILGYTNAGKTSLIRVMTEDPSCLPKDRLFATLDVTLHGGSLPNRFPILYADTVGFISNLPTTLVASFSATLDDIRHADVLVHIRDLSHPDRVAQRDSVLQTLNNLNIPPRLIQGMIEVCNKVDLLEEEELLELMDEQSSRPVLYLSCANGTGLADFGQHLEKKVLAATGNFIRKFKLPIGGGQVDFLREEAAVIDSLASPDGRFMFVTAILSESVMKRFQGQFGGLKKVSGISAGTSDKRQ